MPSHVRTFAKKNPIAVVIGTAIALVALFAAIETSDMLPLSGQAMPMYGPLPTPSSAARRKLVPAKQLPKRPSTVQQRKDARMKNASSAASR